MGNADLPGQKLSSFTTVIAYCALSQASSPSSRQLPLVPLLGYFTSAPSDEASSASTDDQKDSIWLVYK